MCVNIYFIRGDIMQYFIFAVSAIAVIVIAKIFSWPFKKLLKLALNIILGLILILIVNNVGIKIGLHIPFNVVTAFVSGILGVPGVIGLSILNYIF